MGFIRFLFAIAVVISHTSSIFGYRLIPGELAVQSFFMISGFYMALVLNEKYIGEHKSYKLFLSNRLIRLYPTYWTVLICTVLFSVFYLNFSGNGMWLECLAMYRDYWDKMSVLTIICLIVSNIFIFFQDQFLFLSLNLDSGNLFFTSHYLENKPYLFLFFFVPQTWSVALELLFYLCAPFLLRRKLSILVILILLSLILRIILIVSGFSKDPWSDRFFFNELGLFLLGAVAYKIYVRLKNKPITNNKLGWFLFFSVVVSTFVFNLVDFWGKYVFFIMILFIALPHIFLLTKRMTKDRWIGDLSYPIYISHMFVVTIVSLLELKFATNFGGQLGLVVCIGTILFSILLNQLIEIPLDKYRQKRIARSIN